MSRPQRQQRLTPAQASSRLVRVKTSDAVAEHIIDLLFAGELRAGDRIDIDGLTRSLDISRAPVREALVSLERDGLVEILYHRGAFVADFDADAITESFELYAMLSALTSRRVAETADEQVLTALADAFAVVQKAEAYDDFEVSARNYRRIVNVSVSGSRMRALLRSFGGLVPVASRLSMDHSIDAERRLLAAEHAAILAGDGPAAAAAAVDHISLLGRQAVRTLQERGVIGEPSAARRPDELLDTIVTLSRSAGRSNRKAKQ